VLLERPKIANYTAAYRLPGGLLLCVLYSALCFVGQNGVAVLLLLLVSSLGQCGCLCMLSSCCCPGGKMCCLSGPRLQTTLRRTGCQVGCVSVCIASCGGAKRCVCAAAAAACEKSRTVRLSVHVQELLLLLPGGDDVLLERPKIANYTAEYRLPGELCCFYVRFCILPCYPWKGRTVWLCCHLR
jgi:hypothetical protein